MSSETPTAQETGEGSGTSPTPQPAPTENNHPEERTAESNAEPAPAEEKDRQQSSGNHNGGQHAEGDSASGEKKEKEKSPKKGHKKHKAHHDGDQKSHAERQEEQPSEEPKEQEDTKGKGGSTDNTPRRKKRTKSQEPAAAIYTHEMTDHVLPPLTNAEIARREIQWSYTTTIDKVDAFQQSRLKKLKVPGETLGSQTTTSSSSNSGSTTTKASQGKFASKSHAQVSSSVDLQKAMKSATMWLKLKNGDDTVLRASGVITPTGEARSNFYVPAAPSLTKTFERDENYRLPKVPAAAGGAHTARVHHSQARHSKHPSARGAGRGN